MRISDCSSDVCSSDLHGEWPLKRHKLDPARRRYVQVPPDFCVVPGLCGGIHRLHRGFRDFQIDSACRHTLVSRHRRERDGHVSPHEAAVFPVPHLCLECRPGEVVADEGNRIGKGCPSVSRERQPSSIEHVFLRWLRERGRSEEHTSELQSLMRISYAVFCLKKKRTLQVTDYPLVRTASIN